MDHYITDLYTLSEDFIEEAMNLTQEEIDKMLEEFTRDYGSMANDPSNIVDHKHEFAQYSGLTEVYEYCTKCDHKVYPKE